MSHLVEKVFFPEDVAFFAELCNLVATDGFDGYVVSSVLNLGKPHLSVGTFTDNFADFEIVDRKLYFLTILMSCRR